MKYYLHIDGFILGYLPEDNEPAFDEFDSFAEAKRAGVKEYKRKMACLKEDLAKFRKLKKNEVVMQSRGSR